MLLVSPAAIRRSLATTTVPDKEHGTMPPLIASGPLDFSQNDNVVYDSSSVVSISTSSLISTTGTMELDDSKYPPSAPTKTKSVRFSTYSELYYVPNRDDYDQQEMSAVHMSESDQERIMNENHYTLWKMKQGIYPDSQIEYFRGLEAGIETFHLQRKHFVRDSVSAVLRQQKERGRVLEPSWVEHYYTKITAPSVFNAIRIGLWDAQVARNLIKAEMR